jgi:hypothetical protein
MYFDRYQGLPLAARFFDLLCQNLGPFVVDVSKVTANGSAESLIVLLADNGNFDESAHYASPQSNEIEIVPQAMRAGIDSLLGFMGSLDRPTI